MNLREWALPIYTVLIQMVTGMFLVLWLIRAFSRRHFQENDLDELAKIPVLIIFFTILIAILGSHSHLSHPFKSFLALSNLRTSWLSREVFFTLLLFLFTAALLSRLWLTDGHFRMKSVLGWGAIASGLITLWCMARIYLLPTQAAWNSNVTFFSTYGTAMLLGSVSMFVILLMDIRFTATNDPEQAQLKKQIVQQSLWWLMIGVILSAIWVIAVNIYSILSLKQVDLDSARVSLELLLGLYQPLFIFRVLVLFFGLVSFVYFSLRTLRGKLDLNEMIGPVYISCLCVLVGQILERFLFYATHVRIGL